MFVHTLFMIIFECMCAHMLICKYILWQLAWRCSYSAALLAYVYELQAQTQPWILTICSHFTLWLTHIWISETQFGMQLETTWHNRESIFLAMMLLYHGGYSGTTWIYNHFPSHIKYFGSHIPKVPTKLQQLASTALNFDTVRILADFPLA